MKAVDGLALDLERIDSGLALDERAHGVIALQLLRAITRHLHEFPADPVSNRGQLDGRTAGVAGESDSLDVVVPDDGVDDEPALHISRAHKLDAQPFSNAARSAVACDDEGGPRFALPTGSRHGHCHAALVLLERAHRVLEDDADVAEAR